MIEIDGILDRLMSARYGRLRITLELKRPGEHCSSQCMAVKTEIASRDAVCRPAYRKRRFKFDPRLIEFTGDMKRKS